MTETTLKVRGKDKVAYRKSAGKSKTLPGVMFLGGFHSDMTGTKATFLEDQCTRRHQSYVRFDYTGHGQSSGKFEEGNISAWLGDAEAVLENLTTGPQILVGSSMGGWIALLLALKRPERLKGLVLLAPAPDFSEDIYYEEFGEEERRHLALKGTVYRASDYGEPYPLTKQLFEDAKKHLLLDRRHLLYMPLRIIHGKEDPDVPWEKSEEIMERFISPDAKIYWVEDGDHRLSRPEDLAVLDEIIVELSQLPRLEPAKEQGKN